MLCRYSLETCTILVKDILFECKTKNFMPNACLKQAHNGHKLGLGKWPGSLKIAKYLPSTSKMEQACHKPVSTKSITKGLIFIHPRRIQKRDATTLATIHRLAAIQQDTIQPSARGVPESHSTIFTSINKQLPNL